MSRYSRSSAGYQMPIEETNPDTGCANFPGPLRASIYALLETVLALSEKVAEMPLCPEQIEHVYQVRDAARELNRLLMGPRASGRLSFRRTTSPLRATLRRGGARRKPAPRSGRAASCWWRTAAAGWRR